MSWTDAFSVEGRSVVITGASRGIGAGIARVFGEAGAHVTLAARDPDTLDSVRQAIEAAGGRAIAVPTDVGDDAQLERLVAEATAASGGVDVLINNAAAPRLQFRAPPQEMSADLFDETIRINLRAVFLLCQIVAQQMIARGQGGSIINIGSVASHEGLPQMSPYSASKGGLIRMSETMAWDWGAHGIRVNCVSPGFIESDENRDVWDSPEALADLIRKTPVGRSGKPEDVGYACLYLASSAAGYITGQSIITDGGYGGRRPQR